MLPVFSFTYNVSKPRGAVKKMKENFKLYLKNIRFLNYLFVLKTTLFLAQYLQPRYFLIKENEVRRKMAES